MDNFSLFKALFMNEGPHLSASCCEGYCSTEETQECEKQSAETTVQDAIKASSEKHYSLRGATETPPSCLL